MKKTEVKSFLKRNKNFSLLWTSQVLSQVTLNMINFVMATRIYEKTGSTLAVSFLWVFYYMPSILFGPFTGYAVDRFNLRKMLTYVNATQGFVMLLFLLAKEALYPIYSVVFLYSLTNLLYFPAEASSLVWLVDEKDLHIANSLFMLTSQGSIIVGLGLSGVMMRLFGQNIPILFTSVGLFLAALSTYYLPKREPVRVKKKLDSPAKFLSEIKSGFTYILNHRVVLFPIVLLALFQVFLVAMGVSLPSISSQLLNLDLQDAGPLLVVPAGLGAFIGTYLLSKKFSGFRKKSLMKRGFMLAFLVFLFMALVIPYLRNFKIFLTILLMIMLGTAGLFILIPSQTLLQEKTPLLLRGRVFGTLGFSSTFLTLPVILFTATLVDSFGVKPFMFLLAAIMLFSLIFLDKAQALIANEINGNN